MKKIIAQICAVIICSAVLSAGGISVDFDGRNANLPQKNQNLLKETMNNNRRDKTLPDIRLKIKYENGEFSEIKAIATWTDENGDRTDYYILPPDAQAKWNTICNNEGEWTAKKTYAFSHDKDGGHYHYNPPPPPLKYARIRQSPEWPSDDEFHETSSPIYFPVLQGKTTYHYWIWYPEFGARTVEWFEASGACQGMVTSHIFTAIRGLAQMTTGQYYILVGTTSAHPYNHYATTITIDKLKKIANEFHAQFPKYSALRYNDFSLMWGGLFDIGPTPKHPEWQFWRAPHSSHRYGRNADVSYKVINAEGHVVLTTEKERKKIEKIFKNNDARIFKEKDHWHLTFPDKNDKYHEEELRCY